MDALIRALKPTLLDVLSIFIASILGAVIVLVTFKYEFFAGFTAYLAAAAVVVFGVYLSKRLRSSAVAHVVNIFVVSLVCISVTFNATQILASFIVSHMSGFMSKDVEDFTNKYALTGYESELLGWTVLTTFALVLANRWGGEFFKGERSRGKDTGVLDRLCLLILWLTSFPVNLGVVLLLLVASLILMALHNDIALFAAVGGPITIIGLLSTVKFTTIEKYLKREDIIVSSTGVTGPPVSQADAEIIAARSQEATRKRLALELRSELTGIALTVFGTIIWAYGAYLPILSWLSTITRLTR